MVSRWVNTIEIVNPGIEKPCVALWYCPYGLLVEAFPMSGGELVCTEGGHDCPVHYLYDRIVVFARRVGVKNNLFGSHAVERIVPLECPVCGNPFEVDRYYAGTTWACPMCRIIG